MRRLSALVLLALACGRTQPPATPRVAIDPSYAVRGGGGQLVIGALLPEPDPVALASLLTPEQLARFKAMDPRPPREPPEEPFAETGMDDPRSAKYGRLESELSLQLSMRVLVREILPSERDRVPVLLAPRATLAERCRAARKRLRRFDADPFRVARAWRKDGRGHVEFGARPVRVTIEDLAGNTIWTGDPAKGFGLDGLAPYEHRVVAHAHGMRRAWTVGELVGTVERDILARRDAVAGGTFAMRIIHRDTKTGAPVAGQRTYLRLTTGPGKVLGETTVISDAQGTADVRLAIPEDTADTDGHLFLGDAHFRVRIHRQHRLSIVTDRTLYRPTDRVFVRLMLRRYPSGRAVPNTGITLRYRGLRRTVTTSGHGIASTEFQLRDAKPGQYTINARCGKAQAEAKFTVETFELPRFEIGFEPPALRLRRGESAPLRIVARYVTGSAMADTPIEVGGTTYRTDERGEVEITAREVEPVVVRDADGRKVRTFLPVTIEREPPAPARDALPPIRFDNDSPKVGDTVRVDVPDENGPLYLDLFRDGVLVRTLSSPGNRFRVGLTEDLAGTLDLHAYTLLKHEPHGHWRRLVVRRRRPLDVVARPRASEYRPGDTALVDVTVKDGQGEPTAAVLGYWAVDQALLARASFGDGHETTFDLAPRPPRRHRAYTIRERRTPRLYQTARRKAEQRARASIAALLKRIDAIYHALPVEDIRSARSVRERLSWHVARGELDPALLLDPWGTPWSFLRTGRGFMHWSSAGPDLCWGTPDDVGCREPLDTPEEVLDLVEFIEEECDIALPDDLGFWNPGEWNTAIGLGGAGGGRHGRGGRRNLRAGGGSGLTRDPVRLRRESEPTLCFVPEAIVGPNGSTRLEIPLADALTTWRMRLVASRHDGATGIGFTSLRVRQPLSVEPWIAPHLTVGDELDLPVAARNETAAPLRIRVRLRASSGIDVVGPDEAVVEIGARRTGAHTFRIRAVAPGTARLRVGGAGGDEADAVERLVTVRPNGREFVATRAGAHGEWMTFAHDRAHKVQVHVYPDPVAEAWEGIEGMIRAPHGCFEQTSSKLYPMVLVLRYLRRTGQSRPALEAKAKALIERGYRKLLTYEVESAPGGFSLWGEAPADPRLSAYGLMEFADMADVLPVDPRLLDRIERFLVARQAPDGSWGAAFGKTAYIAWALRSAGRPNEQAHAWLAARAADIDDPYARALAALAGVAPLSPRNSWVPKTETVFWSRGRSAEIEATALAAQAFLAGDRVAHAHGLIRKLMDWRGPDGRFGTTQSTVQALRAILAATTGEPPRPVEVSLLAAPGKEIERRRVQDSPVSLDAGSVSRLRLLCDRALPFTVSQTWYEPWTAPTAADRVGLEVEYPTEPLEVGRTASMRATVFRRGDGAARQVVAEIGVPPGCDILHQRVKNAQSVERGPTAVVIYLGDMEPGTRRTFEIPLVPRYRLDVRTGPSRAYEYYTPEEVAIVPPAPIRTR